MNKKLPERHFSFQRLRNGEEQSQFRSRLALRRDAPQRLVQALEIRLPAHT
jgi:hypothetical protein